MIEGKSGLDNLVRQGCAVPGCLHKNHDEMFLHSRCHIQEGVWVKYTASTGVLDIHCRVCKKPVCKIKMTDPIQDQLAFMTKFLSLGATGKNVGSLGPADDGELKAGVVTSKSDQLVMINFGKPVGFLAMDPQQAVDFAQTLITNARKISDVPLVVSLT